MASSVVDLFTGVSFWRTNDTLLILKRTVRGQKAAPQPVLKDLANAGIKFCDSHGLVYVRHALLS